MRLEGTGWAWGVMKPHGAVVSQRHGTTSGTALSPCNPPQQQRGDREQVAMPRPAALCCPLAATPSPRLDSALCFWGGGLQAKGHSGCTPLPPPAQTHPSQDMRQLERWIWGLEVVQ